MTAGTWITQPGKTDALKFALTERKKGWQEIKLIEIHKIFKYYEDAKIQNIFSVVKLDKMRIVEENANHHQARRA